MINKKKLYSVNIKRQNDENDKTFFTMMINISNQHRTHALPSL